MNLLNQKVKHKTLGAGTVTGQDESYITVTFASKTSKFQYPHPDTFAKFLTVDDESVQGAILKEIADAKLAEEAAKAAADELKRKTEEEAKARKEAEIANARTARTPVSTQKQTVRQVRTSGKRMTFFVFQGNTYDRESRGGYIWAPISNKAGNTFHHWDRLLDIRGRDIIFHGYNGYIQAVSTARGECYECAQPEELRQEDMWDHDGRRVDCDYVIIKNPVKTSMFVDDILRLSNVKYAPFDKDGNGNMGYLYELNRELARIFMQGSSKRNAYLNDIDFISELLTEANNG